MSEPEHGPPLSSASAPPRGRLRVAAVLLAAAPLGWFAAKAWSRGAFPVFDDALIGLRIHDVLSSHPPTLGAGTSFGRIALDAQANHPGPLAFYLLAPVWGLTGFRPGGLVLSLLVFHVAFVVLIAVLAWRLAGDRMLLATLAVVLLLERSFGVDLFTRVFNPYLGVLPFLATVLACWVAMVRSPWYLVLAAFTGSVAVQAQVSFGPPTVVVVGVAVLYCAASAWSGGQAGARRLLRAGAVAFAVGLVCWAAPGWQELTTEHGNLSRLWAALDRSGEALGLRRGFAVTWQVLGHFPPRLAGFNPAPARDWLDAELGPEHVLRAVVTVVGLAALLVVLVRRGSKLAAPGVALALVGVLVTVPFVSTVPADAFAETYQFLWIWVLDALLLLAVGAAAFELLAPALRRADLRGGVVVAVAGVSLVALTAAAMPATYTPQIAAIEDQHRGTIRVTRQALEDRPGPFLVSCLDGAKLSLCATLTLALETVGIRTRHHPRATFLYGPDLDWRRARPDEVLPQLFAYRGPDVVAPVRGARLVSDAAESPEEAADARAATQQLAEEPVVVSGDDVDRLNAARYRGFLRLMLETSSGWFRGGTAREWNDLIRSEPARFVGGGGLAVLDDAGLLADRPSLSALAERWQRRPSRDVVWLAPAGPPGEPFPRRPPE